MQKQKLVPEIRFKGFNEKWNINALNELINKFDNLRIPVSEKLRTKGEFPYYGANGIQDYVSGYTHDGEFVLVAEDGANDLDNYPSKYVNGKFWANNHVHVIQGKENILDNKFLSFSLKNFHFKPILTGGERSKLNASALATIEINKPFINEQQKIGQFFSNIDSFIQSEELKLKKLNEVKRSLLSKMFASENSKFPEIRFKGFEEEWKTAILDDFIDYERPDKYIEKLPLLEFGRIPVLTANKSFKLGYTESKNYYAKGDCILFDDFTLDSKYVNFPFMVVSSALKILTLKNNQDSLSYYFAILSNNTFESQGHARHYISVVAKTSIKISDNITERNLIGSFCNYIDSLISSQELKLQKLNNIKQALLEKMFC
ncbi:restriction endonuclease subunit S [Mycoplasma sp. SK928A]|uniref:restriction endonuclease subunit S n=3 Tax=unclassified Mycoplasma TaxID=2683645 RepID=UPI003AB00F70